jgi:tetratricopeptide (TPR) repeat protein
MAKTGRNNPCPCGSGKKYKQCCLAKDETAGRTAPAERAQANAARRPGPALDHFWEELAAQVYAEEFELTEASNAVVDLIHAGKLDEAEEAANDLLECFPGVHDGYDRLGMVYEARGDNRKAAEYYRKVVAVAREHPDLYDDEFETIFQELADKLDPPSAEQAL